MTQEEIKAKYPGYDVVRRRGTKVNLQKLLPWQLVIAGGQNYHYLLTKKKP